MIDGVNHLTTIRQLVKEELRIALKNISKITLNKKREDEADNTNELKTILKEKEQQIKEKDQIILTLSNQLIYQQDEIQIENDEKENESNHVSLLESDLQKLRKQQHKKYFESTFYKEILEKESKHNDKKPEEVEFSEVEEHETFSKVEEHESCSEVQQHEAPKTQNNPPPLPITASDSTSTSHPYPQNTNVIMGDSMLLGIDESKLNTNYKNIKVRPFSGASINDMTFYSKPILLKKPKTSSYT